MALPDTMVQVEIPRVIINTATYFDTGYLQRHNPKHTV